MDHPNVMKVIDTYEDKKLIFLVMDLMVDDLRNVVMNNQNRLDEQFVKKLFIKMAKAVHYCHQNNVVHRDIKLENFLVDVDQDTGIVQVKLTDFGVSRQLKEGE